MNTLARKIGSLLPELEMRGTIYLFALAEREDVDRWDVVLSSSWSDENYTAAVRIVADAVVARVEPSELTNLAGVRIIPSNDPDFLDMPSTLENSSLDDEKVIDVPLSRLDIRRAYIFKTERPRRGSMVVAKA